MLSVTTGTFANGSLFAFGLGETDAEASCECRSETTGVRWEVVLAPLAFAAPVAGGSDGSRASVCSFGTRSRGKPTAGTDRPGSGAAAAAGVPPCETACNARASGPKDQRTVTSAPRPAHQ